MINSYNHQIACEPPKTQGGERKVVNGVATLAHRSTLTALKVIFGTPDIKAGSKVWFQSAHLVGQRWHNEIHEVDGQPVVFVPENIVLLVEQPDA